jgi:hypothetical protein
MNVTKGHLPNVNVANSFVSTMEEYIKEPVEGHFVTDEYVQVKNLIVTAVPPSMDFNGGTTDLFDVGTKRNRGLSLTSKIYSFASNFNCSGKSKERVREPMIKFDDVLDKIKVLARTHKTRHIALNIPPMGLFYPTLFVFDVYILPHHGLGLMTMRICWKIHGKLIFLEGPTCPTLSIPMLTKDCPCGKVIQLFKPKKKKKILALERLLPTAFS